MPVALPHIRGQTAMPGVVCQMRLREWSHNRDGVGVGQGEGRVSKGRVNSQTSQSVTGGGGAGGTDRDNPLSHSVGTGNHPGVNIWPKVGGTVEPCLMGK